ncbi:hypothetical protein [Kribbella sindirgiensis]|uniref:S1 motif domain-containing protein n=1 Tax=Kribbella sindirgiensis TaxID=1124744 RepID=A0A4R0J6E7_9ACTN|nr:hypothetical protein [Kribbella sindirgiensis]TCC36935.1 hypothetical protein E0H50_09620 [Kribbella sindirgiensis]
MPEHERSLMGSIVEGRVLAVFRWGVIVDLGLSHVGLIDALYIDDGDMYVVGGVARGYLTEFNPGMEKFWIRPLGKTPIKERYGRGGQCD